MWFRMVKWWNNFIVAKFQSFARSSSEEVDDVLAGVHSNNSKDSDHHSFNVS